MCPVLHSVMTCRARRQRWDTAFAECSEEECTVLLDDDKIELQRVTIDVPTGSDITGVTL